MLYYIIVSVGCLMTTGAISFRIEKFFKIWEFRIKRKRGFIWTKENLKYAEDIGESR